MSAEPKPVTVRYLYLLLERLSVQISVELLGEGGDTAVFFLLSFYMSSTGGYGLRSASSNNLTSLCARVICKKENTSPLYLLGPTLLEQIGCQQRLEACLAE